MALSTWIALALAVGAVGTALTTYPYLATAIAFRQRDNGLAYILLIMGVGTWNGMYAAQLLSSEPLVDSFFFALSIVGALLAGLGWFLFASTASSTPQISRQRLVYGTVGVFVGIDVILTITAPAHSLYWTLLTETTILPEFAHIIPLVGYWLHTQLLIVLFGAGTVLFAAAWVNGTDVPYTRLYTVFGAITVVMILGSNILLPGAPSVAPIVAGSLTTIGWKQAQTKSTSSILRSYRRVVNSVK